MAAPTIEVPGIGDILQAHAAAILREARRGQARQLMDAPKLRAPAAGPRGAGVDLVAIRQGSSPTTSTARKLDKLRKRRKARKTN